MKPNCSAGTLVLPYLFLFTNQDKSGRIVFSPVGWPVLKRQGIKQRLLGRV
jgi:hypothetical protein